MCAAVGWIIFAGWSGSLAAQGVATNVEYFYFCKVSRTADKRICGG